MNNDRARLEEIKQKWDCEEDVTRTVPWLIAQLETAWKREEIAREALERISEHMWTRVTDGARFPTDYAEKASQALEKMESVK